MNIASGPYVIALFFLFSLYIVVKFKKKLPVQNREGYNSIVVGLTILTLITLANIYYHIGFFKNFPFVSEAVFFRLIYWIGVIFGITILINGVTNWLPLSRSYLNYNKTKIQHLELIKKIEQIIRVETRVAVVFQKSLEYMVELYGLQKGAVYVFSQKSKEMTYITSVVDGENSQGNLNEISFNKEVLWRWEDHPDLSYKRLIKELPSKISMPDYMIPIKINRKNMGAYLLWNKNGNRIVDEDKINLKIAIDIIAHKIKSDYWELKDRFNEEQSRWQETISKKMHPRNGFRNNLNILTDHLSQKVAFDLFMLTIFHDDNNIERFSFSKNNRWLSETGLDFYRAPSIANHIYHHHQPLIINSLANEYNIPIDEVIFKSGMNSVIVYPVLLSNHLGGIVVLASKNSHAFRMSDKSYLERTMPFCKDLIQSKKHHYCINKREKRIVVLNKFMDELISINTLQELFQKAASLIYTVLKPTMVRISTFDSKGTFLNSQALKLIRSIEGVVPAKSSMILSLMPYHRQVRDTGKSMMINQEQTSLKINEAEEKQMFGQNLKSALLIPIKVGNATLGIITLAEMRKWRRYHISQEDIQFVTSMAKLMSIAIQMQLQNKSKVSKVRNTAATGIIPGQKNGLKTSLSGLIGSVELLKQRLQPEGDRFDKCLSILDRSTKKISEYFSSEIK